MTLLPHVGSAARRSFRTLECAPALVALRLWVDAVRDRAGTSWNHITRSNSEIANDVHILTRTRLGHARVRSLVLKSLRTASSSAKVINLHCLAHLLVRVRLHLRLRLRLHLRLRRICSRDLRLRFLRYGNCFPQVAVDHKGTHAQVVYRRVYAHPHLLAASHRTERRRVPRFCQRVVFRHLAVDRGVHGVAHSPVHLTPPIIIYSAAPSFVVRHVRVVPSHRVVVALLHRHAGHSVHQSRRRLQPSQQRPGLQRLLSLLERVLAHSLLSLHELHPCVVRLQQSAQVVLAVVLVRRLHGQVDEQGARQEGEQAQRNEHDHAADPESIVFKLSVEPARRWSWSRICTVIWCLCTALLPTVLVLKTMPSSRFGSPERLLHPAILEKRTAEHTRPRLLVEHGSPLVQGEALERLARVLRKGNYHHDRARSDPFDNWPPRRVDFPAPGERLTQARMCLTLFVGVGVGLDEHVFLVFRINFTLSLALTPFPRPFLLRLYITNTNTSYLFEGSKK